MNLSTVATLAGYKSHYTADGKTTLCGREVSNATSGIDMCKSCDKAAAKLQTAAVDTPVEAEPVEPTYTAGQPVSIYATVTGETEEFEAAHVPNGNSADVDRWLSWAQDNPNWTGVRAANYTTATPVQPTTPESVPTLVIEPTDKHHVKVSVGQHTMTIRNGSNARLRAALWARGHGYRPVKGHALRWHRDGKLSLAAVTLAV
jgi:hypothetical protein